MKRQELDGFVVNVEFLLISVIQGAALASLGASAISPLSKLEFQYFPYIFSALVLILIFWAQAIVHTISFIKWPIDLPHNFLYFLVGFIEIVAFGEMTDPLKWFGFIFFFFIIAAILYLYDLRLMYAQKKNFQNTDARKKLFTDIVSRQKFELKVLVPLAILFNGVSFLLIYVYPNIFITQNYQLVLILIQLAFSLIVMGEAMIGFEKRIKLVTKTIGGE